MKFGFIDKQISFSTADKITIIRKARDSNKETYLYPVTEKNGEICLVTSPKQNQCGKIDIMDACKTLKRFEPNLFYGSSKVNREELVLHMAPLLKCYPLISKPIIEIYAENPQYFYTIAVRSKKYDSGMLCDGHLLYDIAVKRIFGVLLAAESDDDIRHQVEDILYAYDTKFKMLVNTLSPDIIDYAFSAKRAKGNSNAYTHIFLYLLLNKYGQLDDPVINLVANSVIATDKFVDGQDYRSRAWLVLDNPLEKLDLGDEYTWRIIREISSSEDITSIAKTFQNLYNFTDDTPTNQIIAGLIKNCKSDVCKEEIYNSLHLLSCFLYIANKYGLSTNKLLEGIYIDQKRRNEILTEYSRFYVQVSGLGYKMDKPVLTLNAYVAMSIIYILLQHIVDSKKVFFENNNETMYSTVAALQDRISEKNEEIERLKANSSTYEKRIDVLNNQIQILTNAQSRETKELLQPYSEENILLKRKISELEAELKKEIEKNAELNTLRSFVFDIQREYYPEKNSKSLSELTNGKRIIVIGGHINWRNNLKNKYPAFQIFDGNIKTADLSSLQSADFVFLNVSNMSHALYYKAMNILRENDIPFDYLGRTVNQELYEKEMADILIKHQIVA